MSSKAILPIPAKLVMPPAGVVEEKVVAVDRVVVVEGVTVE